MLEVFNTSQCHLATAAATMAMKRPSGSIFVTQSKKKLNINKKPAAATDAELTTRDKIDALNDKIAKCQNGTISEDNFSQDDKHKCWDRFHKQVQKMPEGSALQKGLPCRRASCLRTGSTNKCRRCQKGLPCRRVCPAEGLQACSSGRCRADNP